MSDELEFEDLVLSDKKPTVSFTQLSMFLRCPGQWYHRYVEGKKIPPAINLTRGSSYHKALETNFVQKIKTGVDLTLNDLTCAFAEDFDTRLRTEDVQLFGESASNYKDSGVKMVKAYYDSGIMHKVQPKAVERTVTVPIPGLTNWDITGVIDIEDVNDVIIDHKTSSSKWAEDKGAKDQQMTTYGILKALENGTEFEPIKGEFHVAVSTKTPYIQHITLERTKPQMNWWMSNIKSIIMMMEVAKTGTFICNTDGWWCSQKWCGYYDECMPSSGTTFSM